MISRRKAMVFVLIGVVMVSYSGPLVKAALLEGAAPVTVAFTRMLLAALFMLPLALRNGAFKEVKQAPVSLLVRLAGAAGCLALHYWAWMTSLNGTSTFASVALVCTQPLFVAALSFILFREKVKKAALPGALIAVLGAVLIGTGGLGEAGGSLRGDLLALAGALFMAGHWLFARSIRRTLSAQSCVLVVYAATAIVLFIITLLTGSFSLPGRSLLYVLGLAVGCTLLGHALFTLALGAVSANTVAFALLFEPVGAMVWAVIFFREIPAPLLAAGGACVLLGLALYLFGDMR
jgi:drug/metabolite transporter (DMT)-like permease